MRKSPKSLSVGEAKASPPKSWSERALADADEFVAELTNLRETKRGYIAQLRRNAGKSLPGHGTAWFYRYLYSPQRKRYAEVYFLVATLFDWNRKKHLAGDFGSAVGRTLTPTNKESLARRFRILLDAAFEPIYDPMDETAPWQEGGGELAFRLRQMVKLLASKEVGVDWAQLLVDLIQWSRPDRRVQKRWARSFFGAPSPVAAAAPLLSEAAIQPPTE